MAEEWLGWAKHRESTRATYRSVLITSLSAVHDRPVSEVTAGELYDLLKRLSPGAVASAYAVQRGAFSRSVAMNLVTRSPVTTDIRPPKHEDSAQVLRRVTPAEVQDLRERFRKAEARLRSSLPTSSRNLASACSNRTSYWRARRPSSSRTRAAPDSEILRAVRDDLNASKATQTEAAAANAVAANIRKSACVASGNASIGSGAGEGDTCGTLSASVDLSVDCALTAFDSD